MSDPTLAVTTANGTVSTSEFSRPANWSSFVPITELSTGGVKNVQASIGSFVARSQSVCAIDDSLSNQLRFTQRAGTTWATPLLLGTGAGQANIVTDLGASTTADVLALGGPTVAGWSFGLPHYVVESDGRTFRDLGDYVRRLNLGALDPNDPPVAFDASGRTPDFWICLATAAGGLYAADATPGGSAKFEDVKTAGAGDPGNVISVSLCQSSRELHLFVVNDAGRIFHTLRRFGASSWLPWGNVSAATRSGETFVQVSTCYQENFSELHLAAVTSAGGLLYSNRNLEGTPDPVWLPFVDVKSTAGNPGVVTYADIGVVYQFAG